MSFSGRRRHDSRYRALRRSTRPCCGRVLGSPTNSAQLRPFEHPHSHSTPPRMRCVCWRRLCDLSPPDPARPVTTPMRVQIIVCLLAVQRGAGAAGAELHSAPSATSTCPRISPAHPTLLCNSIVWFGQPPPSNAPSAALAQMSRSQMVMLVAANSMWRDDRCVARSDTQPSMPTAGCTGHSSVFARPVGVAPSLCTLIGSFGGRTTTS